MEEEQFVPKSICDSPLAYHISDIYKKLDRCSDWFVFGLGERNYVISIFFFSYCSIANGQDLVETDTPTLKGVQGSLLKFHWRILTPKPAALRLFLGNNASDDRSLLTADALPPIEDFQQLANDVFNGRLSVSRNNDVYEVSIENLQYNDTYIFLLEVLTTQPAVDNASIEIILVEGMYPCLVEIVWF